MYRLSASMAFSLCRRTFPIAEAYAKQKNLTQILQLLKARKFSQDVSEKDAKYFLKLGHSLHNQGDNDASDFRRRPVRRGTRRKPSDGKTADGGQSELASIALSEDSLVKGPNVPSEPANPTDHSKPATLPTFETNSPTLQQFVKLGVDVSKLNSEASELMANLDSENTADDSQSELTSIGLSGNSVAKRPNVPYERNSPMFQQLVELGVDVSKLDSEVPELLANLDPEKDIKQYVVFLQSIGLPSENLGNFFTKNLSIFEFTVEDLQVRIDYLLSKKFTADDIARMISKAPKLLALSTVSVDRRLAFLQNSFKLTGDELRNVVVRCPKLTVRNWNKLKLQYLSIKGEFRFSEDEMKALIVTKPKIWLMENNTFVERFIYLRHKLKIPNSLMVEHPGALLRTKLSIKQRHLYLKELHKAEYDPIIEGYVTLKALTSGNDEDFCREVTKTSYKHFKQFLKTLETKC